MTPASPSFLLRPDSTERGRVYTEVPCPVCKRSLPPLWMEAKALPQILFHSNRNRPDCRLVAIPPPNPCAPPKVIEIPSRYEAAEYARRVWGAK